MWLSEEHLVVVKYYHFIPDIIPLIFHQVDLRYFYEIKQNYDQTGGDRYERYKGQKE